MCNQFNNYEMEKLPGLNVYIFISWTSLYYIPLTSWCQLLYPGYTHWYFSFRLERTIITIISHCSCLCFFIFKHPCFSFSLCFSLCHCFHPVLSCLCFSRLSRSLSHDPWLSSDVPSLAIEPHFSKTFLFQSLFVWSSVRLTGYVFSHCASHISCFTFKLCPVLLSRNRWEQPVAVTVSPVPVPRGDDVKNAIIASPDPVSAICL